MISYIIGDVAQVQEGSIVLENNKIGYYITMPGSSLYRLSQADTDIKVYTYMAVREDDVSLFGFLTKGELDMFKLLIQVSGVGPKAAIGILTSISVDDLKMAIVSEDDKMIAGAKGVGRKTAQKIVVELKGKINKDITAQGGLAASQVSAGLVAKTAAGEAVDALEALGFSRTSSVRAVSQIELTDGMTASDIIGLALNIIE